MALEVIGTGHGRTGTHSLKLALEQLGFGKCYHMAELIEHPDDVAYFEKASRGEPIDWDALFSGYHSACDFPIILYLKELISKYPDAKLIHTTRDTVSWFKSFSNTILKMSSPTPGVLLRMLLRMPFSSMVRKRLRVFRFNAAMLKKFAGERMKTREGMIAHFDEYNEHVLKLIPKDRLLIYDVKTGWEPLCSYLGVAVPDIPFPVSNTTEEFVARAKKL